MSVKRLHRRRPFHNVRRPGVRVVATALAVCCAAFAATALAAGSLTLGTTAVSSLSERVVVDAQGRTLYTLSGETTGHLLCKSSECLKFWPPLTVSSRKTALKAGAGVHGRLGILRRRNGVLQVTLRGLPLYRFAEDHHKGEANGQGIVSFGGTWRVISAGSIPSAASPAPTSSPGYSY